MGNTVARSHIRDADRGVAKATRANTRRNTTGFTHDPALSSNNTNNTPTLQPTSLTTATASVVTTTIPLSSPPSHHNMTRPAFASSPPPPSSAVSETTSLNNQTSFPSPQTDQHGLMPRQNSASLSTGSRMSFPENRHSFTYGSLHTHSGPSHLAPDAVLGDFTERSPLSTAMSESAHHSPGTTTIAPRRRERHPSANISFSRNTSSQSVPGWLSSSSASQSMRLLRDDDCIEPDEVEGQGIPSTGDNRVSRLSQRGIANIDPNLPGGTVRDCQTARTQTPPRVDKPPRARKVVSFNENVHVVTYPNEGSSTHSSAAGDTLSTTRYSEGKQPKRRTRSVFRLLSKVAGPAVASERASCSDVLSPQANCFSSQYDTCCGLRLNGATEVVYDEPKERPRRSPSDRQLGEARLLSFGASKELRDGADLAVSFERTRQTADKFSVEARHPELYDRNDTVVDDFDYTERRDSEDDETLSLSDAHPSRDVIDEPEAIGDQLLSPSKDTRSDGRIDSSFNITPLWQRLKRVDELDAVVPLRTPLLSGSTEQNGGARPRVKYLQGVTKAAPGEDGYQATSSVHAEVSETLRAPRHSEHGSASTKITHNHSDGCERTAGRDEVAPGDLTPDSETECESERLREGLPGMASVMYASPSALDLGPSSDPLSMVDPASDVDALIGAETVPTTHVLRVIPSVTGRLPEPDFGGSQLSHHLATTKSSFPGEEKTACDGDNGNLGPIEKRFAAGAEVPQLATSTLRPSGAQKDCSGLAEGHQSRGYCSASLAVSREVTFKSLRSSSSLLPGEDTSEASIYEEHRFPAVTSSEEAPEGMSTLATAAVERGPVKDTTADLELDPMCLPSHDEYSVAPCSPAQSFSPLAGVFYGTSSPSPVEANSPEIGVRAIAALADYPEYVMLKGHGNEDSAFGSEPNTPVLRAASGWDVPFKEVDLGEQQGERVVPRRHGNYEDRATRQPVPEVLLHDWSGSTPVEPNVEMVDSAPNSRSSTSYMSQANPRQRDQQHEFPNAALLLSTRLSVDMSKLNSTCSDRSGVACQQGGDTSFADNDRRIAVNAGDPAGGDSSVNSPNCTLQSSGAEDPGGVSDGQRDILDEKAALRPELAWVSSDYESEKQNDLEKVGRAGTSGQNLYFTSIPGLLPPDPKLQDFQMAVERKSCSETGFVRGGPADVGTSFVLRDHGLERPAEPSSDFRTFSQDPRKQESTHRRLTLPQRRRRLSNLETTVNSTLRDDSNPFRGVMGRLLSGMHMAKRLVSPN